MKNFEQEVNNSLLQISILAASFVIFVKLANLFI